MGEDDGLYLTPVTGFRFYFKILAKFSEMIQYKLLEYITVKYSSFLCLLFSHILIKWGSEVASLIFLFLFISCWIWLVCAAA